MPAPERELEVRVGRLLQAGVALAGATMTLGGVLYIARHGAEVVSYGHFHTVTPELRSIAGVARGARLFHPAAIIQLGVLIMIATPVLRVAFAIFGFARERDWLYTGISVLVLGLLTYALWGA